jgi:hypothetical protein
MHVFLDESGGLSFDFRKGGTTRCFVVCLLVLPTVADYRQLAKAIERTIHNKLHKGRPPKTPMNELKGSKLDLAAKRYFYRQADAAAYQLYTLILRKGQVIEHLRQQPERLYNVLAHSLIERCPFRQVQDRILLILDRRKPGTEI